MKKDIRDYFKIYNNFLDLEFCSSLIKKIESNPSWKTHEYYTPKNDQSISYENELSVLFENSLSDDDEQKNKLISKIWHAINHYITEDLKDCHGWFNGWTGYSYPRFNRYDPTTQMRLHCDHIHSIFDGERKGIPILTILGTLNDDYTGGEFVMWGDEVVNIPVGSVAIFPSNFLYPHEVKPVKSGTRYSYVSWAW